jgi:hypothetical protein
MQSGHSRFFVIEESNWGIQRNNPGNGGLAPVDDKYDNIRKGRT